MSARSAGLESRGRREFIRQRVERSQVENDQTGLRQRPRQNRKYDRLATRDVRCLRISILRNESRERFDDELTNKRYHRFSTNS